jgi:RNA polymerase sigma-70 factor (ECF subfamily)
VTTFEEFYEDTIDTVTSYVLRRCDSSGAPDVISEAYVIAWRKHAHKAPNPIGFLLLTARRVLDRTRRGQASQDVIAERLSILMARSGPSAEDVALRRREVAEALARLSDLDREALLLSAWDGLSSAEVGQVLDMTAGAVRVRIHRARQQLVAAERTTNA